ncbi:MAG: lysylphosphatidylglycerol synthase domain-containing protein, partial [Pirellulaceae bacterium]
MNGRSTSNRGRLFFWLKTAFRVIVLSLVTWGIWRTVDRGWAKIAEADFSVWQLRGDWLLVAGCAYLLGMLPCGVFWYRTLHAMGQQPRLGPALRAFYVGHLGKYSPGKALVVVIRTALIRGVRVDTTVAATSVFVETLTMMAVGAVLAAVILAVQFREQRILLLLALFLAACAGVPTLPFVFRRLVVLLQVHRASDQLEPALRGLNFRLMLFGWGIVALGWLLFGFSLWATLKAIPGVEVGLDDLPLLTACASLAMVAGFLSLLPAGIGVREYVIMTLILPQFGELAAVGSAVLLRLVWLIAEV